MDKQLALLGGAPVVPKGLARRWPVLDERDRAAVSRVIEWGVLCGAGAPELTALEREFAAYVGARFCLATNSGTAALHLALAAAGVGPGDEVIVPALSFVATAQAVFHQNAVPVFVDIDPRTFTVDPAKIEERITPRTRAIVPVHLHGLPADMAEILALASRHGLAVIEDAAQAHGAEYRGRKVGTLGELGAFSLNATKNLPAGEGGLLVTNSQTYRDRAALARSHGLDSDPTGSWNPESPLDSSHHALARTVGWMYLPTEMSAALARSGLARLDQVNGCGQANARALSDRLATLPGLRPPVIPSDRTHVFHKYRLRLHPEQLGLDLAPVAFRDLVLDALRAEGVEVVLWQTHALPAHPLFKHYYPADYPETRRLLDSSLIIGSQSFPLFCQPPELIDYYADAFDKVFAKIHDLVAARA
ncbi:MAG: DegT/DnrJ/EryC1/StrS family aminotransferase [Candidatus Methylomirabilia bacterium]